MYKGRSTESGESVADPVLRGPPSLAPPPPPSHTTRGPKDQAADRNNGSIGGGWFSFGPRTIQSAPTPMSSLNGFSTGISEGPSPRAFGLRTVQWRWLVFDSSPF